MSREWKASSADNVANIRLFINENLQIWAFFSNYNVFGNLWLLFSLSYRQIARAFRIMKWQFEIEIFYLISATEYKINIKIKIGIKIDVHLQLKI